MLILTSPDNSCQSFILILALADVNGLLYDWLSRKHDTTIMWTNILVGFPILLWSDRKMIQHYSTNTLVYYCKWWCMYGSAGPKLMWSLGIDTCRWDLQEYWYQFLLYIYTAILVIRWLVFRINNYFICITDIGQDFKKLWSWLYLIGLPTFGKYLQCENLRYQYY